MKSILLNKSIICIYLTCITFLFSTNKLIGQSPSEKPINIGITVNVYSEILEENREIQIYTPKGFWSMDEQMENLPVIYVLDGESQFQNVVSSVDFLSSAPNGNDFIPRSIVVGIPNTNRNLDLTPIQGMIGKDSSSIDLTGGGPAFLEFITSELMPYIDQHYSTCHHRTIIGHSFGGLLALEALLRKREYFKNYVIIDPALGFDNESYFKQVLDTINISNLSDENVFFASANSRPSFVGLDDLDKDHSEMLALIDIPNNTFFKIGNSHNWAMNYSMQHYSDENHFSIPLRATYDAMKFFYSYYTFKEMSDYYHPDFNNRNDLLERMIKHYEVISTEMECFVLPMEGYLNSFAFGLGHYGRNDLSIELFEYNIKLHPENPMMYNNLGYFYRNNGKNKEAIEQFNKSLQIKQDQNILDIRNQLQKD